MTVSVLLTKCEAINVIPSRALLQRVVEVAVGGEAAQESAAKLRIRRSDGIRSAQHRLLYSGFLGILAVSKGPPRYVQTPCYLRNQARYVKLKTAQISHSVGSTHVRAWTLVMKLPLTWWS